MKAMAKLGFEDYKSLLDKLLVLMHRYYGERLLSVALFGSIARGEASPRSDVDLIVVYRGDKKERDFVQALMELRESQEYLRMQEKGILAEPYPIFFSEEKLANTPWILLDVLDHGIILYDREEVLQKKLEALRKRLKELGARRVVLEDGTWYWDLKPDWKPGEVIEL
jgi:hypothetical protein